MTITRTMALHTKGPVSVHELAEFVDALPRDAVVTVRLDLADRDSSIVLGYHFTAAWTDAPEPAQFLETNNNKEDQQ